MARLVSLGVARFTLLWVLLAVVCSGSSRAADLVYRPAAGGLQISLTTNGYKFHINPGVPQPIPSARERRIAAPGSFLLVANVVLANRGGEAVPFIFPDAAAAERKFRFRVFAEDGTKLWESDPEAPEDSQAVEAKLVKRSPWRRTLQVPLHINGTGLASGRYTLEASVDAEGGPGATAVFEVVNPGGGQVPVPPNTGIVGRVIEGQTVLTAETLSPSTVETPVAGAYVTVREILPPDAQTLRAPFTWSGFTDANGGFRAPTIAGRFKVTASRMSIYPVGTNASETTAGLSKEGAGSLTLTNSVTSTVEFDRPIMGWPTGGSTSVEVEVPLGQFVSTTLSLPPLFTIRQPNVYSVEEVTVQQLQTLVAPSPVRITARGTVTSGGWSNAQLVPRVRLEYFSYPTDIDLTLPEYRADVLEFDMIATPPTGPTPAVMTPIVATKDVVVPEGVREIRVYSRTNIKSAILLQPAQ